jgi:hypothetical protein
MTCHKSDLTHKHHIIPRYMGGPDTPENLVEVTVTQHAMFHFCNYQLWGNVEDYVAWRGLSGQISEEEFLKEKFIEFGKKGYEKLKEKLEQNPELKEEYERKRKKTWEINREKHVKQLREIQKLAVEAARTPENIEKKKKKLKEIGHQQGEKNSQHGTVWIYNKELRECTRIPKDTPIPEGWHKGRIMDFGEYERKFKEEEIRKEEIRIRKKEREIKKQEKIKLYEMYYNLYLNYGFKYIKENFNYDKTQESLIMSFKRYVKDYVPFKILEFRHKHPKTP